jgi:hypothetical protein
MESWEIVFRSRISPGRKVVVNRCALTEKDDGALGSRTVAKGFSKVSGEDITDSHEQVTTDF